MSKEEFKTFIKKRISTTESELLDLLHNFPDDNSNGKIKNEFFMIRCNKDEVRYEEFIEFLLSKIVRYVLRREEYLPKGISQEKLVDISWSIVEKAKKQFISDIKSGEIGEITLFVILESKNIIQVLNKMNLKTSQNLHVNGLDAIHIQVDNDDIILHYGEAKTYGNFNSALKKAIKDLSDFHTDISKRKSDLKLVSMYIDDSKFGKHTEVVKKFINPYTRHKENFGTCNSIYIGYDWKELQKLSREEGIDLTTYLTKKFQETHKELSDNIQQEVQKSSISDKNFRFYLMPFGNIQEFRQKFLVGMGKNVKTTS